MQQIRPPGSGCHFAFYFLSDFSVIMSHYTNYANPGTLSKGGADVLKKSKVKVATETAEEAALPVRNYDKLLHIVKGNGTAVCAGFVASNIPQALETGAEERFTKTGSPREPSGALCHRLPRIVFDDGRIVSEFLSIRKRAD